MILYGEKVKITGIEAADQPFLNELINDPAIEHMTAGECFPVSMSAQNAWFQAHGGDRDPLRLAVRDKTTDELLGMIYVDEIDNKNRKCSTGIKLGGGKRGRGYGFDAVMTLLRFLFDEMNFHRVECQILEYNRPSQKLYEKCGFVLEGRLRKTLWKAGAWQDQRVYSLLREDYLQRRNKNGGDS